MRRDIREANFRQGTTVVRGNLYGPFGGYARSTCLHTGLSLAIIQVDLTDWIKVNEVDVFSL